MTNPCEQLVLAEPMRGGGTRSRLADIACRVVNVVVAALGILLAGPVMLLIALTIRLTSRGPALYTQPRVGIDRRGRGDRRAGGAGTPCRREEDRGGCIFTIYKFRTMTVPQGGEKQVWASADDPRITSLGAVLRKHRIDELPQLFNVLAGDMNIVGPRPEQPEIFRDLRQALDGYVERQRVLPGITGWAQVHHAYDQHINDVKRKVELDLEYIRRRSPVEDLKIMMRTPSVMAGRKRAI